MNRKENHRSLRDWQPEQRPRERLLLKGSSALTDSELLALLLGSGSPGESAVETARKILQAGDDRFRGVARLRPEHLLRFRGVGLAKAVTVAAAMEISRRFAFEQPSPTNPIRQSADAFRVLQPFLAILEHEEFWVLYLNNANRVLGSYQLSKGGLTGTLVDVRLLLRKALEMGAVAVILAHNHPSGNLRPSKADRQITRKIIKAAATMDVKVLDHLIVSDSEYYSFADEQLM